MVKKVKKYFKLAVCCALILSLIAPSYAALSASDGSAFVTKAEFDSALADFNARLTTFEAGINSKIDSQVTSYLDRNGIWNGAALEYKKVNGRLFHNKPYDHWAVNMLRQTPYLTLAEGVEDTDPENFMSVYQPGVALETHHELIGDQTNYYKIMNLHSAYIDDAGGTTAQNKAARLLLGKTWGIRMASFYPFKSGLLHDPWIFSEPMGKSGMLYLKFGYVFESWSTATVAVSKTSSKIQEFLQDNNMHTWTWTNRPNAFIPGTADYQLIEAHETMNCSDMNYVDGVGAYLSGLTTAPKQNYSAMTGEVRESVQLLKMQDGSDGNSILAEYSIGSITLNNNIVNNSNQYFALHPRGVSQFMVFVNKGDTVALATKQTCISRFENATGWSNKSDDYAHIFLRVEDAKIY